MPQGLALLQATAYRVPRNLCPTPASLHISALRRRDSRPKWVSDYGEVPRGETGAHAILDHSP